MQEHVESMITPAPSHSPQCARLEEECARRKKWACDLFEKECTKTESIKEEEGPSALERMHRKYMPWLFEIGENFDENLSEIEGEAEEIEAPKKIENLKKKSGIRKPTKKS